MAVSIRDYSFELFDFDPATGKLANNILLQTVYRSYGVEFSPSGRLLYGTDLNGQGVFQYDLQAGSAAAIASAGQLIATTSNNVGAVQAGPDGRLYLSIANSAYLAVITNPDVRGVGCGFREDGVYLNGKTARTGLPNYYVARPVGQINYTASFTSNSGCAGTPIAFAGTLTPTVSGAVASWNFGDAASGGANTATGLTPTHTYTVAGTYQVTLTVTVPGVATPLTATQQITVAPLPQVSLGSDVVVCANQYQLSAGAQPGGTTYRWQDGSTDATYLAKASGRYSVSVTSAAGCSSMAAVNVTLNAVPSPRLPADTTACATTVLLRPGSQPAGSTYRWQDGSTSATYLARASGTYSVLVTTPQGCTGTAASRVQLGVGPSVSLGADTVVCPNAMWVVRTNPQPAGALYRWQDGSTNPIYLAHGPGQYSVEVRTTAAGCPTRATRVASATDCPIVIPNIITPNGDHENEFFALKGLISVEWHLVIFDRWGRQVYDRAHYDNSWNAANQTNGMYYYLLNNEATGERYRGWVEVVRGN